MTEIKIRKHKGNEIGSELHKKVKNLNSVTQRDESMDKTSEDRTS